MRDGSITPGIPGRDTGLLPYPGGPMAGPCGVIRLDGGIPGLCREERFKKNKIKHDRTPKSYFTSQFTALESGVQRYFGSFYTC